MNKYNSIAKYYDGLAQLVFFGQIHKSNIEFIQQINKGSQILILGGGTGKILSHFHQSTSIDFVDNSFEMIELAKKVKYSAEVSFHHLNFEDFKSSKKYDYVLCPYFLDLFDLKDMELILTKIKSTIKDNGVLIVSDFNSKNIQSNPIKKILIIGTILFFKLYTGLKIKHLEDVNQSLSDFGWKTINKKTFFFGMIFSSWCINERH